METFFMERDRRKIGIGRSGREKTLANVCKRRPCVFLRFLRRNMIPLLLQTLMLTGPSAEIGVWFGDYSARLLDTWKRTQHHILVDPYLHRECPRNGLRDKQCMRSQREFDTIYQNTRKRMVSSYGDRARIIRNDSILAAEQVLNSSLGFVYIDARHDHDAVVQDLEVWWPKIRQGGIIAGHDFTHIPLAAAVVEFMHAEAPTASIFITADHPASWIIAKC